MLMKEPCGICKVSEAAAFIAMAQHDNALRVLCRQERSVQQKAVRAPDMAVLHLPGLAPCLAGFVFLLEFVSGMIALLPG